MVVGTYTGWSKLTTNLIPEKVYPDDILELTQDEDGTLTAVFKNKTWGTATCKGINTTLTISDDVTLYVLHEGKGDFVMFNPRDNTTQTFPCELTAGYVHLEGGNMAASIIADMTSVEGGHGKMYFYFQTGETQGDE